MGSFILYLTCDLPVRHRWASSSAKGLAIVDRPQVMREKRRACSSRENRNLYLRIPVQETHGMPGCLREKKDTSFLDSGGEEREIFGSRMG